MKCLCGSDLEYDKCCKEYNELVYLHNQNRKSEEREAEPLIVEWMTRYGAYSMQNYLSRTSKYLYIISEYLNQVYDLYLYLDFEDTYHPKQNEIFHYLKHNILLTLFAASSCLAQGLFIQSGILLRSAIEDCFVILDLFTSKEQFDLFIENKYKANKSMSRINKYIPNLLFRWYGYFSSNFTHAGPLHRGGVEPRACHPDHWLLVAGFQNLVWVSISLHIVCERIYFTQISHKCFWSENSSTKKLEFSEDNKIFAWMQKLGKELVSKFPPDKLEEGFFFKEEKVNLKI